MNTSTETISWLDKLSKTYDLAPDLIDEYKQLFQTHNIPLSKEKEPSKEAEKIVMVSTHGYWADPPPAGVPDTGGQTYYVLEVSKAWAKQGRKVIILARWFKPYPRVESLAKNLWLVRIRVGGDEFVRKEDIYPLVPEMAEAATAISALFGADAVMGHYADGMTGAIEVAERLKIPAVVIPHSMGISKLIRLGSDPLDPEAWFDPQYNFWIRESYELPALMGTNLEIANTSSEPAVLKDYYRAEFPHTIMPAGAGDDYFEAYKNQAKPKVLKSFSLESKKYLIFFGRLSEAKNIPGTVAVLGEAKKLDPQLFNDVKLAIVGGEPENTQDEESVVEGQIVEMMKRYGLTSKDVLRIESQGWETLSTLAKQSIFYVGMQMMEPFGMAVAEAMAAGTPVLISKSAGITKWLEDGKNALIVDPNRPNDAAKKLVDAMKDKNLLKTLSANGHKYAKENFSWASIAKRQGALIDTLHRGDIPQTIDNHKNFVDIFNKRVGRAYHRFAFAWRGDPPIVRPKHKKAAEGLIPHIKVAALMAKKKGERLAVALGGESGAGKSEVAEYLRFLLRREGLWGVTVPGDAFFKLVPSENYQARIDAHKEGRLEEYLGPTEVDLKRLESIVRDATLRKNTEVFIPSDCRTLKSRRYEKVPVNIANTDVILVDLTYSLLLKSADIRVFFESDYKKRTDEIKERNLARDPDQDFDFILNVLEIEHAIIQRLKKEADLIINTNYEVTKEK